MPGTGDNLRYIYIYIYSCSGTFNFMEDFRKINLRFAKHDFKVVGKYTFSVTISSAEGEGGLAAGGLGL